MSVTKLTLGVKDLMQIFNKSRPTIYRWHGDGTLPATINLGGKKGKRHLIWSRDSILSLLENQTRGSPQSTPPIKSATEIEKRVAAAVKEMEDIKTVK